MRVFPKMFIGLAAGGLIAVSGFAVEDGLGTNIVKNLMVMTNGVIELGGVAIGAWTNIAVTDTNAISKGAVFDGDNEGEYTNLTIKAGAVIEAKIGDGAVTTNKLGIGAVTSEKLAASLTSSSLTVTNKLSLQASDVQTLDAGTTINPDAPTVKIKGNGAVTLTSDPQIAVSGIQEGRMLIVRATDSVNTVELVQGKGLSLAYEVPFIMGSNDVISFQFAGTAWIELYRADN